MSRAEYRRLKKAGGGKVSKASKNRSTKGFGGEAPSRKAGDNIIETLETLKEIEATPQVENTQEVSKIQEGLKALQTAEAEVIQDLNQVIASKTPEENQARLMQAATLAPPPVKPKDTTNPLGLDLTRWEDTPRNIGDPNYFQRSLSEWRAHQWKLKNELYNMNSFEEITQRLIEEGYKFDELDRQIREIVDVNDYHHGERLRQDRLNVSQAAADEEISKELLEHLGFVDTELLNTNPVMGTDLKGTFNDRVYNIDAQQRYPKRNQSDDSLNLSVYQFSRNLLNRIMNNENESLELIIKNYLEGRNVRGVEGKLLQTLNERWNPNPTEKLVNNPESFEKDLLISNVRNHVRNADLAHNKVIPIRTGIIDLDEIRNEFLPRSLSQIEEDFPDTKLTDDPKGSVVFNIGPKDLKKFVFSPTGERTAQINEILRDARES